MFKRSIIGLGALNTRLGRIQGALKPDRILDAGAAVVLNRIRKRFLDEVDTNNKPWIQSAAARKRAQTGKDGGTLFDSGTLFHSIGIEKTRRGRSIGTSVSYAEQHQKGEQGMVKREFIGMNADDKSAMLAVTRNLVRNAVRG